MVYKKWRWRYYKILERLKQIYIKKKNIFKNILLITNALKTKKYFCFLYFPGILKFLRLKIKTWGDYINSCEISIFPENLLSCLMHLEVNFFFLCFNLQFIILFSLLVWVYLYKFYTIALICNSTLCTLCNIYSFYWRCVLSFYWEELF